MRINSFSNLNKTANVTPLSKIVSNEIAELASLSTENSISYKEKQDYEVFGTLLINTSLPLKKITKTGNDYLKPITTFRYSPNNTKNISSKNKRLSYDNIFLDLWLV